MAQAGTILVGGDAGGAVGDSLYEAVIYVGGHVTSLGSDAKVEELTAADVDRVRQLVESAGFSHVSPEDVTKVVSAKSLYQLRRPEGPEVLMTSLQGSNGQRAATPVHLPVTGHVPSHSFPPDVIGQIHEMAELGRYEIRGWGAKRQLPTFDDLVFLTASLSRYPLEGYRERCDTDDGARYALCVQAAGARHPDHDRWHELRRALGQCQGSSWTCRDRRRHLDDDRRRRHDRRGAPSVAVARLPVPAFALRVQPGRPASGRRNRGRDRTGGQARRRRDAARPEGERARRGHAHPSSGHRPALGLPAPRLDRPGRSADQDRGAPRGNRLGEAGLREARRHPGRPRREARGRGRRRRRRGRRHAGRHRRHTDRLHRARWHPDAACGAASAAEALREIGKHDEVQLVVSGGIRSGADVAKALALGATAVSHRRRLPARARLQPHLLPHDGEDIDATADYAALGTEPGYCHHCHTGMCPVGITTQDAGTRTASRPRGRRAAG